MAIVLGLRLLVLSSLLGCLYPSFYIQGGEVTRKVTESVTTRSQSGLYLYLPIYIYFYRYNYLRLGEQAMVLWNLLDGGPSHSGPLIGPSESMQCGTLGTNPRHGPTGGSSHTSTMAPFRT
jgi:hypothetical protein